MKKSLSAAHFFLLAALALGLLLHAPGVSAGQMEVVAVESAAMRKIVPAIVITPQERARKYPVIYLLHGYGDTETSWPLIKPNLADIADRLGVIFVCPRGENSWYWDSPANPRSRFETFVAKELVAFIDARYPTRAERAGRAVTGLSMGGYGALWLAARNKDVFGAAGSSSGALEIAPFAEQGFNIPELLGADKAAWQERDVARALDALRDGELALVLDSGYDDVIFGVDIHAANARLHERLLQRKIAHDYLSRPGQHAIAYWRNAIDYQILFFVKYFGGEGF
jgi:S-formylglutathione hydrolase FrmB